MVRTTTRRDLTSRALVASYRFQLTPSFGFADVVDLLDPLRRLGVSHVYLSPIAEAVIGSQHGYDVADHRVVRSEFGGDEGLTRLLDAADAGGFGVVIDHVPNHVSVARAELNPRWWELLRDGPGSPAADWFDVDWDLTGGKVIVPKLGAPADDVLASGAIEVATGDLGPELRVGALRFPLARGTEHLELGEALAAQHYRLAWWRDPARNVRRFFTIDDLVAVRVEHDHVAHDVDTLPRSLCAHPAFAGVRVDHVDGLADPQRYLDGLRDAIGDRWLLVEKILGPGEHLPRSWPVDGTTGYEHVTATEHALLDPAAERPLDDLWRDLVADGGRLSSPDFETIDRAARHEVLELGLRPDLERLTRSITSPTEGAHDAARAAVVALTLELERYRTYLPGDEPSHRVLDEAEARAVERAPDLAGEIARFAGLVRRDVEVRTRWQQLTGPVMAKGAEDRAFYRHQRLSALCEVGGAPGNWTLPVNDFHAHQQRVQAGWPTTMLTATTHDTKRSEAVRARSLALATLADDWVAVVRAWVDGHRAMTTRLGAGDVLLGLQTAVTAAPVTVERLHDFLVKAAREADLDTNWYDPNDPYEAELRRLAGVLVEQVDDPGTDLGSFVARLDTPGTHLGLQVLALQLTCPGVPDLYQGAPAELRSLVDPDNRRPPAWGVWRGLVDAAADLDPDESIDAAGGDVARTALTCRALRLRRTHGGAFGVSAGYEPLAASGAGADRVLAFARTLADGRPVAVVVVVRPSREGDALEALDARVDVPAGRWRDLVAGIRLDGGTTEVGRLVGNVGVAVLAAA